MPEDFSHKDDDDNDTYTPTDKDKSLLYLMFGEDKKNTDYTVIIWIAAVIFFILLIIFLICKNRHAHLHHN